MMNNRFILIPGLFAIGMLTGIVIMHSRTPDQPVNAPTVTQTAPASGTAPVPNPFASTQARTSGDRLQALQNQLDRLSQRIDKLEQHVSAVSAETESAEQAAALVTTADATQPDTGMKRMLTTESLVKAGIDPERADDIMRRKNEIELKKLELRDRAIREHYFGTGRYNSELSTLAADDVSLREELGDAAYDRYLYTTGQNNRVKVTSVMTGSQAELADMQEGDIILSYDDRNLFDWSELQQATTQGERGEYVNVNLLRDGQLLNLWIPRGPLGVRLGATRLEP